MGSIQQLIGMIPGANKLKGLNVDEKTFIKIEAIINSMTLGERVFPATIKGSRKKRIAKGSGTQVQEVNRLLKQFMQMQKMMKKAKRRGGLGQMMGQLKAGGMPGLPPFGQ